MGEWLPFVVSLPFAALIVLSGVWANSRFSDFDQLPGHYGIDGQPTRMSSRRSMTLGLSAVLAFTLVFVALLPVFLPADMRNGDPLVGVLISCFGLLGAQIFILWLHERWARSQRGK